MTTPPVDSSRLITLCTGALLALSAKAPSAALADQLGTAAFAAVYVAIRVKKVIPTELQTAQSICFVTAWQRMRHPSQFDDLCRK